ncbi:energy-coupling factor transporter transmembrane protein EcfT [Corynebacterium sp. TAE3-ERU30]|uniref:energy-coupling factor transporter transmembrane component T family protein n=1 Tax=Corynebacterium sp. TAE3-ERU30 TaxID=2849496 RepID=UPI001C48AC7A|nr:energy-coupling factor transporter transmembrane component T [Corynebacterium sp. TAE3-ERU30]MBV7281593.1 energy-coupling factor transporter transmembrane protein EcfT [Corynebacterium sp. TAE3-ERU30]
MSARVNVLRGTNPVTRLLGVLFLTTPLLISVDWVSAGVALLCTLAVTPLCGMSWLQLARRGWPILAVTPISGISMALYGRPEGTEYASFLFAHITDNSLELALAIMLRVLAIGLPVVLVSYKVDPTDFGDGLAQVLKLPARFVIGSVAGVRLMSLFQRDWRALERARRSRGLGDRGRVTRFFGQIFALLVLALRRGSKLATAMEARGFGSDHERTWARESTMSGRDYAVLLACLAISFVALGVSIASGAFRFLGA